MPRTKRPPTKPTNTGRFERAPSEKSECIWCNVYFSDDDVTALESNTATLAELGALLLGVADEGHGFSVKTMDGGESIMCAIIGEAEDNPNVSMGVSSFAGNVRDATLACLYKFSELLGGQFTTELGNTSPRKRRFR